MTFHSSHSLPPPWKMIKNGVVLSLSTSISISSLSNHDLNVSSSSDTAGSRASAPSGLKPLCCVLRVWAAHSCRRPTFMSPPLSRLSYELFVTVFSQSCANHLSFQWQLENQLLISKRNVGKTLHHVSCATAALRKEGDLFGSEISSRHHRHSLQHGRF